MVKTVSFEAQDGFEQAEGLAREVLEDARNTLTVHFRFLDYALWVMPFVGNADTIRLGSEGTQIFYDPFFVIHRFRESPAEVVRDLLHDIFHCVFHHPFLHYQVDRTLWDLSCDIAIEAMIIELVEHKFPSPLDTTRKEAISEIQSRVGALTAERIYRYVADGGEIDLRTLPGLFRRDTHDLWYPEEDQECDDSDENDADAAQGDSSSETEGERDLSERSDAEENSGENQRMQEEAASAEMVMLEARSESDEDEDDTEQEWRDISMQVQMEIESRAQAWGEKAASLSAGLAAANREHYDYASFLKRFSTFNERMRVNDDEFDYIFYTYGLDLYGNMPLIEPLEYKEVHAIRDFVIAIDTSGSCAGDLVQAFVRKTYNILKQAENFSDRVNIHIVQCDARIQSDDKITTLSELDAFIDHMELHGFGGTDFRPVFEYVDDLIAQREFANLRGLIYFTDGCGTFPARKPAYDVAFVFVDDGYSDPKVPPWALKLIVDVNELEGKNYARA